MSSVEQRPLGGGPASTIVFLLCLLSLRPTRAITAFGIEGGLSREQPPPRPEQIWDNPLMRPAFGDTPSSNQVTPVGRVAYLHCRVNHLGSRVVTWIRKRDAHALTVGLYSYTTDQRFTALHAEGSPDWLLKITSPQTRDSGIYECQVSTEPKISKAFNLTVIESKAIISGPSNRHMSAGNTLNLTCWTSVAGERPNYYYWYHNDEVIRYTTSGGQQGPAHGEQEVGRGEASGPYTDGGDSGDHVDSSRSGAYHDSSGYRRSADNSMRLGTSGAVQSASSLVIENVGSQHSGNYSCAPENSAPSTVTVYVLRAGEQPAAMQHGESSTGVEQSSIGFLLALAVGLLSLAR